MSESDFMIMADEGYVASAYEAPTAVARVGRFVEKIIVGKDVETPNSILAFVSGDRAEQLEYIEGLVGIGVFLSILVSLWFFTLLLLKCQGRERMGCSAGYAFHDSESDTKLVIEERKKRGGASGTLFRGDGDDVSVGAAVDPDDSVAMDEPELRKLRKKRSEPSKPSKLSSMFGRKEEPLEVKMPKERFIFDSTNLEEIELHMELDNIVQSATKQSEERRNAKNGEKVWSLYSLPKSVNIGDETMTSDDESAIKNKSVASDKAWGETWLCSAEPKHVERRKFQTRAVFASFAIMSLLCCALLFTHMYQPLESAALTSGDAVQEAAQIVDELNEVLVVLDDATESTEVLIRTTPTDYSDLCPNFSIQEFQNEFGFNPQTMIETVSTQYRMYVPTIVDSLNTAKETGDSVTGMLMDIDEAVRTTNEYLWIIPLVIGITMLIIFSQLALMFAVVYREEKFKNIQTTVPKVENCYAWTVLPLQTMVTLLSWLLVIAFCFGMIVTTDSCIPSFGSAELGNTNDRGTPDDVVLAVVEQYMIASDTGNVEAIAKERLETYITGCDGMESDPLAEVVVLQRLLNEAIDEVDTKLSFANDVLGLQFIENKCGPFNRVRPFFQNLTVLNSKFANVNIAIKQGYDALSCPRVNSLYNKVVHEAFCTDFATANANGLVLLVMISFSGMVLITLRASWRSAE